MNSFLNSLMIWLDIHGSDLDFKNLIKSLAKWLKFKKLRLRFNSMNSFVNSFMIFSKNPNNKNEWYFLKICKHFKWLIYSIEFADEFKWIHWWILMNLLMNSNQFVDEFKSICWWIQINLLMNSNEFVNELKWIC